MTYTREDDLVIALQEATKAMTACGRFDEVARVNGDEAAAERVLAVADKYVAWLRRTTYVALRLVAIEEMDTGEIASTSAEGDTVATTLDSSQQARFDILAQDDRGWATKATLDLTVSDEAVISAEVVETPDPSTPNQLVVKAVGAGTGATVTLSVPDNDTIPDASEAFDVVPGGVAVITLGAATIEEQDEEAPPPDPEQPVL